MLSSNFLRATSSSQPTHVVRFFQKTISFFSYVVFSFFFFYFFCTLICCFFVLCFIASVMVTAHERIWIHKTKRLMSRWGAVPLYSVNQFHTFSCLWISLLLTYVCLKECRMTYTYACKYICTWYEKCLLIRQIKINEGKWKFLNFPTHIRRLT